MRQDLDPVPWLPRVLSPFVFLALAWSPAAAAELTVRVRDSSSGAPLQAALQLYRPPPAADALEAIRLSARRKGARRLGVYRLAPQGRTLSLEAGEYVLTVSHEGYRALNARLWVAGDEMRRWVFWLDPVPGPTPQPTATGAGQTAQVLRGHVYNASDGMPVARAEVSLERTGTRALTDSAGTFVLTATVPFTPVDTLPAVDRLRVTADGFRPVELEEVPLLAGEGGLIVDLRPGSEVDRRTAGHKLYLDPDAPVQLPSPADGTPSSGLKLGIFAPPESIRVGFGDAACTARCCTGNCPFTCVFGFEQYVRQGLNDEWLASWGGDALSAGAIAYRSYAAWHVLHPLRPSYDICSSACCQANDTDSSASTIAAAGRTAGILLERNGAVFRSEYSAENNSWDDPNDARSCTNSDLGCGDGAVGSPAAGWPCLIDVVASGQGCFGHGRGMSQWGSSRWDGQHDQSWKWITSHYYNGLAQPEGLRSAELTSPLHLGDVSADPAAAPPLGELVIHLEGTNLAELAHSQILLGASLFRPSTGFLSDPENDASMTFPPGALTTQRSFTPPAGTPPGSYDLIVALWLDVDGDGRITGEDLALDVATLAGAVAILGEVVFADDFEGGDLSRWSELP